MEVIRNFHDVDDSYRSRQETVQGPLKFPRIYAFRQAKMSHLSSCVDTGIRPARADYTRLKTGNDRQGALDLGLHRRNTGLNLPSVQVGAVVFDK